ncbi:hypothetical protein OAM67_01760 [bacterium]|nr:hypothetical protein [bacterium]
MDELDTGEPDTDEDEDEDEDEWTIVVATRSRDVYNILWKTDSLEK